MMRKRKLAALCLCAAMIVTALVATPARSGNTSNTLVESLACPYPNMQFYDVAWNPEGSASLFVGVDIATGYASACWWYPGNSTWQYASPMSSYTLTLRSVCYDQNYMRFVAIGECLSSGYYFVVGTIGGRLNVQTSSALAPSTAVIHDMVFSPTIGAVMMAGRATSGTTGPVCYKLQGGTVSPYTSATAPYPGGTWYGVETYPSYNALYFVGTTGTGTSLVSYSLSGATSATTFGGGAQTSTNFMDIVYDPYSAKLFVAVAAHTASTKGLYSITLSGYAPSTMSGHGMVPTSNYFLGIDVDESGVNPGRMVLVGYNGTYGSIYDAWTDAGGKVQIAKRSDNSATYSTLSFKAVAVRPSGQPFALVAGSAFKYYYTSAASGVTVDTAYPHIDYLDLYDAGAGTSRLNGQVDVDSGSGDVQYDLEIKAWHNAGQESITQVDVAMWYDGGVAETQPAPFTDAGYENTRIFMRWLRSGDQFELLYPSTGETALDVANCGSADWGDMKNVTVAFRFSPKQQVRFAAGDGSVMPFGEAAGDRYGTGASEQQSNPSALNALGSWNIHVTVWDVGVAQANAYDEFGLFRYTYIGSGGLPGGGSIYGSGPPNSYINLQPNNEDVTFSANCPYQVRASVTDLWNAPHTQAIAASTLQIYGGTMPGWEGFSAAGDYIWLIGTEPLGFQSPQESLTYTTTSSADFNADPQYFQMACTIPTVPEDRYFGTITFSVVHA
jgi:hypothetical protein